MHLELPIIPESISVKKQDLITLYKEAQAATFVRGDYKDLMDLVLLYLGEGLESFNGFLRPVTLHKAHWMAELLYAIKFLGFPRPRGLFSQFNNLKKLQRFILFSVFCYVPWCLTSLVVLACPLNDLKLFKALNKGN